MSLQSMQEIYKKMSDDVMKARNNAIVRKNKESEQFYMDTLEQYLAIHNAITTKTSDLVSRAINKCKENLKKY